MCKECGCGDEMGKMIETAEVRVKTTEPKEVAYTMHKGSYANIGNAFERLAKWINENNYEIAGPSVTICYNEPGTTPENDLISEAQFPIKKKS